ncbi:MAG: NfeD family protein [Alphaproteobacteria bacterium]|nr:NfeD family protein [Alphaproteobacteria bacterium]
MQIIDLIGQYGGWSWIIAGLILLALELILPGGVLVWLGAAAVVTGIVALFNLAPFSIQWVLFGALSLAGVAAWLGLARRRNLLESDRPLLNLRAAQHMGETLELTEAISDGFGRARLGDSTWRVSGPELPRGARVRVTGYDGTVLKVEAAN